MGDLGPSLQGSQWNTVSPLGQPQTCGKRQAPKEESYVRAACGMGDHPLSQGVSKRNSDLSYMDHSLHPWISGSSLEKWMKQGLYHKDAVKFR